MSDGIDVQNANQDQLMKIQIENNANDIIYIKGNILTSIAKIKQDIASETSYSEQLNEKITLLKQQVIMLDAKVQTVIDLADDVVATAGNTIDYVDWIFAAIVSILTVLSIIITFFFYKSKKEHLIEATNGILDKITNDRDLQDKLLGKLVKHKEFIPIVRELMPKFDSESSNFGEDIEIKNLGEELNR